MDRIYTYNQCFTITKSTLLLTPLPWCWPQSNLKDWQYLGLVIANFRPHKYYVTLVFLPPANQPDCNFQPQVANWHWEFMNPAILVMHISFWIILSHSPKRIIIIIPFATQVWRSTSGSDSFINMFQCFRKVGK